MEAKVVDPRIYTTELQPAAYRVDLVVRGENGDPVAVEEWRLSGSTLRVEEVLGWAATQAEARRVDYVVHVELRDLPGSEGPVLVLLSAPPDQAAISE